jgi:hypothetical protein
MAAVEMRGVTLDITFDLQAFDPIGGSATTQTGAVAWDGASSDPGFFNQFVALTSSVQSASGVTATITGISGAWAGDSSVLVAADPLRADYFVIATGATATLTLSGLAANSIYTITWSHGNNQPGQLRGLDILGQGITGMDIDNQSSSGYDVTFTFMSDAAGMLSVGLMGLGPQEGSLAGFRIIGFTPIPEPGTASLLVLGGMMLVAMCRFRRSR